MKKQSVYLLCGVPGSGKTWVAERLSGYQYVRHDDYIKKDDQYLSALVNATNGSKPVVTDCPFLVGKLIDELKQKGIDALPYLVDVPNEVLKSRYEERDKKPIPKQHFTNAARYRDDKERWRLIGTGEEVLAHLEKAKDGFK